LRREIAAQIRSWSPSVERAYQMDRPVPVPPRFLGYGLLGFAALGYPPDEVTEAMVWYLAAIQRRDGHWEPGFRRPPLGGGEILSTTLALRALQLYPVVGRSREFSERIGRARSWLRRSRPRTHQERVFQVLGLSWAGSPREELAPRIETLLEEQRDDGGWAQLPGLRSDAWATGQSLVALRVGGGVPADHPAYRRGVDFLLRTQFEDGSWYVKSRAWPFQPRFDSKFPHGRDQWVSAPATAWAVMGLTLAVEPFAAVTVFDASPAVASPKPTAGKPTAGKPSAAASEAPAARSSTAAVRVDFAREIQPLLERSCVGCHAGKKPKGNFRVTGRASLIQGGESGEPAIVPGRPGESPLIRFVSGRVEDMEMPPLKARRDYPALTKREIDRLRAWIQGGAPWPDGVELGVPVKRRRL
ncbi:MAG: hypothetical protein O7J95_03300, partial [Planctomycetota bacterium]|nr:hypothetical protein [Planctomycetota bacterium]